MGIDDTTVIEKEWSQVRLLQRISAVQKSLHFLVVDPEQVEGDTISLKKEVETFDFEAQSDFWNFRVQRLNHRNGVSCARQPIEAMVWITEMESAKSIADLKTSFSFIWVKLETNFEVRDSKNKWFQDIINGDSRRKVLIQEEAVFQQRCRQSSHHASCSKR